MFHSADTLGPYTLIRTLGRGAFGEVWLAERASSLLTTQVALKMPLVAENDVETVRKEAALWLQASGHPNIVPVLDADIYDGQVVIASEYIAGGSLHDWMTQRVPPPNGNAPSLEEAVAMTNGILAGLDYLHRVGLTHRDIKPDNVLLQDGIPRLTDFGLARVLKTSAQTADISGTPRYMAPETFSGSYSATSDLWAVGVMLQELLIGAHPFPIQDIMALIVAIQGLEPAPLPDYIPERLRSIVSRLLAKSPSDRFPSASSVREALQNSLQPVVSVPVAIDAAPSLPPHNLPVQPTSFIGREKQIAELKGLLERTHLLTLTGSGGCGKTRLSLKVAEEVLEQYPDGVRLVELAPLADAALVPNTVANVLGIKETPGEAITQTLLAAIKGKRLLLVLDNCEHVLESAARLVDAILHSCLDVKLLVSSRETLGIAGEYAYRVPSLSLPDPKQLQTPDGLSQYEAVRLFIERALAVKPAFAVIGENTPVLAWVCIRLDGIPLAIELAAARIRSMTLEELGRRLEDRFRILTGGSRTALPRQQTLRAMIDWSYDLLEANQKALLTRLSVFLGGWTLEAAEQVCSGEGMEEWEVLDLLTALDDKSLVMAEERGTTTRYRLLETVRQYARDRLAEGGKGKAYQSQHRDHFLALAEEAKEKLVGPEQGLWLDRLETEHDNLRQALTFCLEEDDAGETGLRLGAALQQFWWTRGYLSEGREILMALLGHPKALEHTRARAYALNGAGVLSYMQGDYASARSLHEESLEIRRELGDRQGIADSLLNLGNVARNQGDYASARSLHEESMEIRRELGDRRGIANCLNNLGLMAWNQGDYASARSLHQESMEIRRELGDRLGVAISFGNLGNVAKDQGDYASARSLHQESLEIERELGDRRGIAYSLNNLGIVAQDQGDYDAARSLQQESLEIMRELGGRQGIATALNNLGSAAQDQGDYASARSLYQESLEIKRELGDRQGIATSLNNLGLVAYNQGDFASAWSVYRESLQIRRELGDRRGIAFSLESFASLNAKEVKPETAARLWGAAERLREEIDSLLRPNDRDEYDRDVAAARQTLSEGTFSAAWAGGRALTLEQAIEYALAG